MSNLFSIISTILVFIVYITYFKQTLIGKSTPNPATWIIWLTVMIMNIFTYFTVVGGDYIKTMVPVTTTSFALLIFLYALFWGKFTKLSITECVCLILAIVVGMFWKVTHDDIITNLLLQVILAISFYPTIQRLLEKKSKEGPIPWALGVCAYIFLILSLCTGEEKQKWYAYAYPFVNGVLGNGSVAFIAFRQRRK